MRKLAVALLVLAVLIAGCSQKAPSGKYTVVDLAGRKVSLKELPVKRVVITFNFEDYIAVGGVDGMKKIVGWNRGYWKGRREWIWEKYTKKFPWLKNIPDVGYPCKGTFNVEKVVSLKPDVVIMALFEKKCAEDAVRKLAEAGIPVVFIDYHSETMENHVKSTLLLGKLLGKEKRAEEIVAFYKEQVEKVYSKLRNYHGKKPKVYIEGGFRKWFTYGDYMWGALVEKAGGINIAKGKIKTWGQVNPEYVIDSNPDVIVITGSYWPSRPKSVWLGYYANLTQAKERLREWINRPGWNKIKAIREGRVYCIHHGLSRHIYDFVAIQFLAKAFYPKLFKNLDPVKNFIEFHRRFLPVNYSGVWMFSLKN